MSKVDINKTELVWPGKYDDEGKLKPIKKPGPFPFQIVESVNSPRIASPVDTQQNLLYGALGDEGNTFEEGWKNKLIWGDNKPIMSSLLKNYAGEIDLIYIDPPFATGADFKLKLQVGEGGEQITKEHSVLEEKAYRDTWGKGIQSYLQMMYERLSLMKELLSENGCIYIHCDGNIGHYLKIILDEIFGYDNFKNDLSWCYRWYEHNKSYWNKKHDNILMYWKSDDAIFNWEKIALPLQPQSRKKFRYKDKDGRKFCIRGRNIKGSPVKQMANLTLEQEKKYPELTYRQYEDEIIGVKPRDWFIVDILAQGNPEDVGFTTQKPEKLLKKIILASSDEGDLIADFFCGSGTTLAVAEKLGRRWIGSDLSRYAIHLTRKRLLDIGGSKSLEGDNKGKYQKQAKPFEILNLGKYERQLWQAATFTGKDEEQVLFEYLSFILQLYGAEPISGYNNIHGKKDDAMVHVGSVDAPVTISDITDAMDECRETEQKELHVLGWEWEMGINDAIQQLANEKGIKLKLRIIPTEVLEAQAVEKGDVQFFELAYFDVDIRKNNNEITVELKDFVIPNTDLIPSEVQEKIQNWSDWIDYWAIDFNFQNDTFNNTWTSYRTKKDRLLNLKSDPHTYEEGHYKIFVKIVDIFGIDTSSISEVEV